MVLASTNDERATRIGFFFFFFLFLNCNQDPPPELGACFMHAGVETDGSGIDQ